MVSITSQPHYPEGMILCFPFEKLYRLYSQSGHCRQETIPCPCWESNPAPSDTRIIALWQSSVITDVPFQEMKIKAIDICMIINGTFVKFVVEFGIRVS